MSAYSQRKPVSSRLSKGIDSPCQLTVPPTLRRFYLGQTADEITKIIPNFKDAYRTEKGRDSIYSLSDYSKNLAEGAALGLAQFGTDYPFPYDAGEPLKYKKDDDVSSIEWSFYQDRLYSFSVYYADYDPPTARSFAKQLSSKTNLPPTGWIALDKANISSALKCQGFRVIVSTAYRNFAHVTITDITVENEIVRLEKEIQLKRKKEEQDRIRREREKRKTLKP